MEIKLTRVQVNWILSIAVIVLIAGLIYFVQVKNDSGSESTLNSSACKIVFPKAVGYVNDFYHLFSEAEKFQLDSIIGEHEKKTSNQIAIITIDSAMMGKCDINEYTINIANAWGVGQKQKNNGIVIGIAPGLKKIRIQNGNGIVKMLTDDETKKILDSTILPSFKNAQYFDGLTKGIQSIFKELK
ncbi:MAG: TPM domain-containing protein [Sphingobacteriales bacterium]|nr:MAG: TPM domain-containing protein [Sphingobacteriales bacterium]